jgi:hypothetical protein
MLDFWIIEKIKEQVRQKEERPRIQLPVPFDDEYSAPPKRPDEPKEERGVFHININGDDDEG